jgi:hypothetical protein
MFALGFKYASQEDLQLRCVLYLRGTKILPNFSRAVVVDGADLRNPLPAATFQ